MNPFFARANELHDEMVATRRVIHQNAGVGFDLRENAEYIKGRLREMGIEPSEVCECGITATIGTSGKTVLLRADYDALPMAEESGLPFAATNGTCHACGHDLNATSLLYAAKMLKEREGELTGRVKLMFQPAEELGKGAKAMIEGGLLENPTVDAAIGLHMGIGEAHTKVGSVTYTRGPLFAACDRVEIIVHGKGGHGAFPFDCIDPITTGARILLGLQNIIPYEIDSAQRAFLTFGVFEGGKANNAIPEQVRMVGTLRTINEDTRAFIKKRIGEIATGIADAMRCTVDIDMDSASIPMGITDVAMCDALHPYIEEICPTVNVKNELRVMGSEDYAEVCSRVPAITVEVGAGTPADGYAYTVHKPQVTFNEECLLYGSSMFANLAYNWLKDNA